MTVIWFFPRHLHEIQEQGKAKMLYQSSGRKHTNNTRTHKTRQFERKNENGNGKRYNYTTLSSKKSHIRCAYKSGGAALIVFLSYFIFLIQFSSFFRLLYFCKISIRPTK